MREIKFRGLRTDGKGWAYGNLINWHPTLKPRIVWFEQQGETSEELNFEETNYEVIPESVGQFTGLHDKNGKDIFEGDIVLFQKKNHEIRYFTNHGMFGLVGENSYSSNIIDESKPMGSRGSSTNYKPYVLNEYYQKRIEIIGNIHESAELLK